MKTVTEAFGITRPAIRLWGRRLGQELPAVVSANVSKGEDRLRAMLADAATAYRRWRRGEHIPQMPLRSLGARGMRPNKVAS
jgi:hypothetical protein